MKELKKLSLKEELDKEAEDIEKEINSRDDLKDIKVSDDLKTSLFNKIQEYEYNRRFRKIYHRKKKKKMVFLAVAVIIVLVCGSVMTGVGSKSYWKVLWDRISGGEELNVVNVENMDSQQTDDLDEVQVFKQIRNKIGISPVRFGYVPEFMKLKQFEIDKNQKKATLLYDYEGKTIKYTMYMNDEDSSFGQIEPDNLTDEYTIVTDDNISISVKEYDVPNKDLNRYVAEFEYYDAQYEIKGLMEKDEFDKIIKNLFFFPDNA